MSTAAERVETVARAIFDAANPIGDVFPNYWDRVVGGEATRDRYREWAAAAIAAMPPSPAEEAVKRVEALADWYDGGGEGVPRLAGRGATSNAYAAKRIRAALASPAPAPQEPACQWAHGPVADLDSRGLCPVCAEDEPAPIDKGTGMGEGVQ